MPFIRQTDDAHENATLLDSDSYKENLLHKDRNYGTTSESPSGSSTHLSQQSTLQEDDEDIEIDPKVRKRAMLAMPALAIGLFLASVDQTIIISSYAKIGSEMQALNKASWIATTYLITQTSFQPLYGKLSDIFGRKTTLLFAFTVFGIGTLLCGLVRTMNELLAARAIAGIGGGGLTTIVAIILSDVIPLRERGTWQGYANIVYGTGLGVGAPLGGYFADHIGWRWSFIFQVPLTVVGFAIVYFVLKLPDKGLTDVVKRLKQVDFGGSFTLILAVGTLLVGLHEGANTAWDSPIVIGCLCASGPLFAVFLTIEFKFALLPIVPISVLTDRTLMACALCSFFSIATWFGLSYYLPLYWQAVERLDSSQTAIRLVPGIFGNITGSFFAGFVMKKTGKYRWLTVICFTAMTLGVVPIILFTGLVSRNVWGVLAGTTISGFSYGISNTSTLIAMIAHASRQDQAVAIATLYLFRSLGSVIGVSLTAAVIQQVLRNQMHVALRGSGHVDAIVEHIRESLGYIDTLKPDMQTIIRECYEHATRWGFILDIILMLGAVGASFLIREKSLGK